MAGDDLRDMERSIKELKKKEKDAKRGKKKAKRRQKVEKKLAKEERKARKKGVFLEDVAPAGEEAEVEEAEEFVPTPWVRKSTDTIPLVEKKIDLMAGRTEKSSLHELFEERYGESLIVPEVYKEYELSDAEKMRLVEITGESETQEAAVEAAAVEGEAAVAEEKTEVKIEEKTTKSIWNLKQLWLYSRYGKDKFIVIKIIVFIFSFILWFVMFIPRLLVTILSFIFRKAKSRRAKKAATEA